MIANISPSHLSYEDTLNTLKYANRAKNIRVSASQQLIQPDDHVRSLAKKIGIEVSNFAFADGCHRFFGDRMFFLDPERLSLYLLLVFLVSSFAKDSTRMP